MTEEILKKSNNLSERIKEYKKEIEIWEIADSFKNRGVQLLYANNCFEVRT